MEWYAAHTIIAFQREDGVGPISVCENIYLVCAQNSHSALGKAKLISDNEVNNNDGTTINGHSAKCIYGGVRKIVTICNERPPQYEARPDDGSEISYIEYELENAEDLKEIISGNSISMNFIE
ncbi:hypothetical protein [Iodidimonas sp. SYSU 1G8]|uniref:hypothetical protein n=1 Tax=Iodidimonas sp. SYSU 1G8 TaxID=3133967 RepID=UPI0031FF09A5